MAISMRIAAVLVLCIAPGNALADGGNTINLRLGPEIGRRQTEG